MGIAEENNGAIWEESLANQLSESSSGGDYPSFDQETTNTDNSAPISDVLQEWSNDQQLLSEPQPIDWIDAIQQNMWPMKITEEALESMKEQEMAEQEAAADQSLSSNLTETPITNEESYDYDNTASLQDPSLMDDWSPLWDYGYWDSKVVIKRYNTWFVWSVLWMIVFGWLAYLSYLFYQ